MPGPDDLDKRVALLEQNQEWMIPQVSDYRKWRERIWGIGALIAAAWAVLSGAGAEITRLIHTFFAGG